MAEVQPPAPGGFAISVDTLVIGAGAAGLTAALAARDGGREVLVLERDAVPAGSTALSAGLVPAAGTALQARAEIEDDWRRFAADIQKKARGENDPALVERLAQGSAPTVEWLAARHGLPFELVDDFDYPGHSRRRMHGLPSRSGAELVDRLRNAAADAGADIMCHATVTTLFVEGRRIAGVAFSRPDGAVERIGCHRLVLACNGFGGNRAMVAEQMPGIAEALWFGHDGNRGEAVFWGQALGAATRHLGAYQGHGNVAQPHGILITWATIAEGGVQLNRAGLRFWDESQGYSEAARAVLAQPGSEAFTIFDARIAHIARQFADFRAAEAQGAIVEGETPEALAKALGLPPAALATTLAAIPAGETDDFGRRFPEHSLAPPYLGVRVTGALFHTQGGLVTGVDAAVLDVAGRPFPNLHAAGGAACGVSGDTDAGYLSGNGLLSAVVLGRLAGAAAPAT
ncbi:MAG: FAD-dependent oxidoreductase [Pseudomonadota bacterium]